MHEVLVNRLGGLSLPRKSVVRLTDRPDMTLDVYRGRKTTMQQQQQKILMWSVRRKMHITAYNVTCILHLKISFSKVTVKTLNIGTSRLTTVVVLNIKQFNFTMK